MCIFLCVFERERESEEVHNKIVFTFDLEPFTLTQILQYLLKDKKLLNSLGDLDFLCCARTSGCNHRTYISTNTAIYKSHM